MISAATGPHKSNVMAKMLHWVDQVLTPDAGRFCPGATWSPAINLYEDATSYFMVVDLAGVQVNHIELNVEDNMLTLSGHRVAPEPMEPEGTVRLHLMEIDEGAFCRAIDLPSGVNVEDIKASYRCGFLWIRIPKSLSR